MTATISPYSVTREGDLVRPLAPRVVEDLADAAHERARGQRLANDGGTSEARRRLGLSERSLHRRLREEGTTLRALLHELRRTLSERYIREGLSINETAFLLGYSEASAFHRGFRRWTGRTPAAYRRDRTP